MPLVLVAALLCINWRAQHPIATEEDLRLRALMSHTRVVEVEYVLWNGSKLDQYRVKFSPKEFQPFVDSFYLSSQPVGVNTGGMGTMGIVTLKPREDGNTLIIADVSVDKRGGSLLFGSEKKHSLKALHPVTVKRWVELLLANPRIGLQLRAREKR